MRIDSDCPLRCRCQRRPGRTSGLGYHYGPECLSLRNAPRRRRPGRAVTRTASAVTVTVTVAVVSAESGSRSVTPGRFPSLGCSNGGSRLGPGSLSRSDGSPRSDHRIVTSTAGVGRLLPLRLWRPPARAGRAAAAAVTARSRRDGVKFHCQQCQSAVRQQPE
jgi:hypothetical protein